MRVDHKMRVNVIAYATVERSKQHLRSMIHTGQHGPSTPGPTPSNTQQLLYCTGSIYVAPWHAQTQYLKADAESCQLNACWSNFGCVLGCFRVC